MSPATEPERGHLPLLFASIAALDPQRHANLRRKRRTHYRFAQPANAVPVAIGEMERAALEYPIVCAGEGEDLHLVAVVGLTADRNLFVDSEGRWRGRYVPAWLRSYPFALATAPGQAAGTRAIAIDPECDEWSNSEGVPLFSNDHLPTPYLKRMIDFLGQFDAQLQQTRIFAQRLGALGLLRPVTADIRLTDGSKRALAGFRIVDRAALRGLTSSVRLELDDLGFLEAIHRHFLSLQTFSTLVDLLNAAIPDAGTVNPTAPAELPG